MRKGVSTRKNRVVVVNQLQHFCDAEGVLAIENHDDSFEKVDHVKGHRERPMPLREHVQPVVDHRQDFVDRLVIVNAAQ